MARLIYLRQACHLSKRFSAEVGGHQRTWQRDRPWRPCKRVRNMNLEVGASHLCKAVCRQLSPAGMQVVVGYDSECGASFHGLLKLKLPQSRGRARPFKITILYVIHTSCRMQPRNSDCLSRAHPLAGAIVLLRLAGFKVLARITHVFRR